MNIIRMTEKDKMERAGENETNCTHWSYRGDWNSFA